MPSKTKLVSPVFLQTLFFSVRFGQNTLAHDRYAFVVSKKVDKSAVVRNRLRRVLREIVVKEMDQRKQGHDMVVVVKKNFLEVPREELTKTVEACLSNVAMKQ